MPREADLTTNEALKLKLVGVTVSVDDIEAPAYDAVIVTVVDAETVDVSIRNVVLRDPAAMVTLAGTFATPVSLLVISTSAPPLPAALASVTVACGCPCPRIDDGVTESEFPEGVGAGEGFPGDGVGVGVGVGDEGLVPAPAPPHAANSGTKSMRLRIADRRNVLLRMLWLKHTRCPGWSICTRVQSRVMPGRLRRAAADDPGGVLTSR